MFTSGAAARIAAKIVAIQRRLRKQRKTPANFANDVAHLGSMLRKRCWLITAALFFLPLIAAAHEVGETFAPTLDQVITGWSVRLISGVALFVVAAVLVAVYLPQPSERQKLFLFWSMVITVSTATLFVAGGTVYINIKSETGGPVHWHADYRVFACEQELDLIDPRGLSNKIGTPVLHEHGDNRIHVEGVLVEKAHASLRRYFDVIGGHLDEEELVYPTNDGILRRYQAGDRCPDGQPGEVQVFVYQTHGRTVTQQKLTNFADYILSPHERVPPADCLIIEFGPNKERTDKLCNFYEIGIQKGELEYGN